MLGENSKKKVQLRDILHLFMVPQGYVRLLAWWKSAARAGFVFHGYGGGGNL